jgi:hypothetical protein
MVIVVMEDCLKFRWIAICTDKVPDSEKVLHLKDRVIHKLLAKPPRER